MNLTKYVIASLVLLSLATTLILSAGEQAPPMLGIHWARGVQPPQAGSEQGPQGSPDMTFHNGNVLVKTSVAAIFWGTSWPSKPGDKISGMDKWYEGFGGSNYAKTSDEYKGNNGQVSATVNYQGHYVDGTKASGGGNPSNILKEVCKVIPSPVSNGYYPVYTDLPRSGNYCAYHSWASCGGTQVQFGFFWKLDGDSGCDPRSGVPNQSEGLAALANVSGHELSETRTDPRGAGWYDSNGAENGDKCAWTFHVPYVTFSNGTNWKIQGEWSNHAYDTGTGYANAQGQKGCLAGK